MRVLLVGATGLLGSEIKRILEPRHEVITASRKGSHVSVDLSDKASIVAMFVSAKLDALNGESLANGVRA